MASIPFAPSPDRGAAVNDNSISSMLPALESMLDEAPDRVFDATFYELIQTELKRLHARLRVHHAAGEILTAGADVAQTAPEHQREQHRLKAEHADMLGTLDRLIRAAESMADRTAEDKEVFFARLREMIATTRRHETEEDRLFYLSVWRETGGEA